MNVSKYYMMVIVLLIIAISVVAISEFYQKNKQELEFKQEIGNLEQLLSYANNEIINIQFLLAENVSELQKLQSGSKYKMHDPTYHELLNFIEEDNTDKIPYDEETFICSDYAQILNDNAENQGIRCAVISLFFENSGHQIIGFNTIDYGMVYFEPQSDERVDNIDIGKDYWTECVVTSSGYYYEDEPDDTITSYLIYW